MVSAAVKGPQGEQSNFGLLSPVQEWHSQVSPEFGMQKKFHLLLICAKFHLLTVEMRLLQTTDFLSFDPFCMGQI